jgi:hypothetical protein
MDVKILQDVRDLIRENILPRLTELEEQVRLLRKVTWPVCQRVREAGQFADIESKREFLEHLDPEEVLMLLKLKSKSLVGEEFRLIRGQSHT